MEHKKYNAINQPVRKKDSMQLLLGKPVYVEDIAPKDALAVNGNVVPAGMGDGNVAAILKDLYAGGYQGFLSLEPHLFQFSGFAGLERGEQLASGKKTLSGAEAFELAHKSLIKILTEI